MCKNSASRQKSSLDFEFAIILLKTNHELKVKHVAQPVDYGLAVKHYRKTSDMKITGQWMQSAVSRASFNLGFMHQFGLGVTQDMPSAKRFYERCWKKNVGKSFGQRRDSRRNIQENLYMMKSLYLIWNWMPKTRHSISNQRRGFSDIIEWSIVKIWILTKIVKFWSNNSFEAPKSSNCSSQSQKLCEN